MDIRYDDEIAPPIDPAQSKRPLPVYLSELSNLNDYTLFANGGWDGNWYVGFNVCWIEELPAPPQGNYKRAFVGAKLGRAKWKTPAGRPVWEKEAIPGEIYLSLSSTAAWKPAQRFFLVDTADIPLEGDPENALEATGESRWFWVEVPLETVNFSGPTYVALWSPTDYFVSTASSPILAGGWGSQKTNSWLNNDVRGYAPLSAASSLKTPISVFEPAIALKLIPDGAGQNIRVTIDEVKDGRAQTAQKTFIASISGEQIAQAWLEISSDVETWKKHGRYVYGPPFQFTVKPEALPAGKLSVRCSAVDIWGNTGTSDPWEISVSR